MNFLKKYWWAILLIVIVAAVVVMYNKKKKEMVTDGKTSDEVNDTRIADILTYTKATNENSGISGPDILQEVA